MAHADSTSLKVLKSVAGVLLTAVLVAQAAAYYTLPKTETQFEVRPLAGFSPVVGPWSMVEDAKVEPEIQRVLRADDVLDRLYQAPNELPVSLFIAFFKSQTTGVAPHSPKNCLPGSGWVPLDSEIRTYNIPKLETSIEANRYIVAREEQRHLVVYWYQTPHRAIASEYEAKFWLVADALRYRRSDTSLVRIVLPLNDAPVELVDQRAARFLQAFYPAIKDYLPQ